MNQCEHGSTRRDFLRFAGGCAAALAAPLPAAAKTRDASGARPNIVLIFADDLGYGDVGCYGSTKNRTPHIDSLAADGMRFTDFYSCASVCTPSRAGLLTGRYPIRSGLNKVLFPFSKDGIDDSEITMAEMLRRAGYATACVGKWHLGHLPQYLPTRHGFHEYFGIPYSNDMDNEKRGDPPVPLMRNTEIVEQPADQRTLTKRYAEESCRFIRANQDRPFFLYLPHTMPHIPLFVSKDFDGRSANGLYGDVVEEIDWSVGQILETLDQCGIADNTLVIFTSDNGPWLSFKKHGGIADPLRAGKFTVFEGGVREPCVMRWPSAIEAGRVEERPAITLDFLPTFANLASGQAPDDRPIDGRDLTGVLQGNGRRAHEDFFFYRGEELQAVRSGKWKLKKPFKGKIYGEPDEHPLLLFDLERDPSERNNLAEKYPDKVRKLQEKMRAFHAGLGKVPPTKK